MTVADDLIIPPALIVLTALWVVAALVYYALTRRKRPKSVPVPESIRHDTCDLELCEQPAAFVYRNHPSGGRLFVCAGHVGLIGIWVGHDDYEAM